MDRLNRVLANQWRAGQAQSSYPRSTVPLVLPDWVEDGANLVYISKSKGDAHQVTVAGIDKRKQMVKIRFESDRRVWKLVPFIEIKKFGDGTLRPLWKKTEVATVPMKPKDFVEPEEEDLEPALAEAVDPTEAAPDDEEPEDVAMVGPQLPPPAEEAKPERPASGAGGEGGGAGAGSPSLDKAEAAARPEASPEDRARAAAAAAASAAVEEKPKKEKKAGKAKKVPEEKAPAKDEGKKEKQQANTKAEKKEKGKEQEERGGKRDRSASADHRAPREKEKRRR